MRKVPSQHERSIRIGVEEMNSRSFQHVSGKGHYDPVMEVCFAGVAVVVVAEKNRCSPAYHPDARLEGMIGATSRIGGQHRERIRYDGRRLVRGIGRKVRENLVRIAETIGIGRDRWRVASCPYADEKNTEARKETVERYLSNPMLH